MRCSASSANGLVSTYVRQLNTQIESIQKNFNDMDFENASARNEMEAVINNMKSSCRNLISDLQAYRFY